MIVYLAWAVLTMVGLIFAGKFLWWLIPIFALVWLWLLHTEVGKLRRDRRREMRQVARQESSTYQSPTR